MKFINPKIFNFLYFYLPRTEPKRFWYWGIFIFLFPVALPVFAGSIPTAGLVPCGDVGEPPCGICHLFLMVDRVIDFAVWKLAIPLAILMLVIGGIMFIVSGENERLRTQAKDLLTSVFLGLFIIFASWAIIETIMNTLTNPAAFPWPWNEIDCTP